METLQWLIVEVKNQILHAAWAVISNTLLYSLAGLVCGIIFVNVAGRLGLFRRPTGLWKFVACLNYVYVPLLLMALGGVLGFVRGAYSTANRFIDASTAPFVAYGERYMAHLQQSLAQIPVAQSKSMTFDEAIAYTASRENDLALGSYAHEAVTRINSAIANHALDEMKIPRALRQNPLTVCRELKSKPAKTSIFAALPLTLHRACDAFFWVKFRLIWIFFQPLLLLPIAEYVLFRAYRWLSGEPRQRGHMAWH